MLQPKQTSKEKKNLKDATQMKNMNPVFKGPNSKLPQPKPSYVGGSPAKNGKTMKKAQNGAKAKSSFGALSVKAGVDNNYGITAADRISGAKMNANKAKKGATIKKVAPKAKKMMAKPAAPQMPSMGASPMMKSGGKMSKCKYGCN